MSRELGRQSASLFVQVLALVMVSLMIAQLITVLVIFNLPRPDPDVYRLREVADALATGRSTGGERPLVSRITPNPPRDLYTSVVRTEVERRLAALVGTSPDHVAFVPLFRDSPLIRIWPTRSPPQSERQRVSEQIRRDRLRFVELATPEGGAKQAFLSAPFEVGMQLPDGRWRVVGPKPLGLLDPWQQRVVIWFVLTLLVMTPVAYWFSRRLAAPISAFARAAERLGRDPGAPPMILAGSAELGAASRAFNDMQERLRRYVQDRTQMIGAVAHDLRTPLTRLRFRIESAPDDLKAKMASDIDQMEAMVAATLAFVRDASQPRTRTRLELSSLLESVVDEMADVGAAVSLVSADKVVIQGDPVALRRLLSNLIDNALKFGDRARARLFLDEHGSATVEIDDDGPGLSQKDLEQVFEPFFRAEPSRSRHTGGIGLGLAVARSIARAHGGDVTLENRAGGGLRASLRLP
jgi:signal transduction histidine kinase